MATRVDKAWVGIPTFLRAPFTADIETADADIAVFGVPFDEGSPFQGGSRFGPRAIREHSLRFGSKEGFHDIETGNLYLAREVGQGRIVDIGDADILPTSIEESFSNVTNTVRRVLDRGLFPVSLGGDHTISYPVVRAFDESDQGPIHVVHFDAHLDYSEPTRGMITNGMPFRLIHQLDSVSGLTQIGIRSLRDTKSTYDAAIAAGSRIVPMSEMRRLRPTGIAGLIPEGARCYVSMDVDALDASLVPGTVSAEPNGMTYAELRDSFRAIAERHELVGFDFVEVCPPLDVGTGVTSYLGTHLVIECLGIVCQQGWWKARVGA